MRNSGYVVMLLLLIFFIGSCGNATSNKSLNNEESKESAAAKFDSLEKIFGNDNWLVIVGKDSNYFYFSRLSANNFKTYSYKMQKGDSTASVVTEIKATGDSVFWQLPGKDEHLLLKEVNENEAIWMGKDLSNSYAFKRLDANRLLLKYHGGDSIYFVKTITLSSFLVKSKHDYKNGTHLAFENIK